MTASWTSAPLHPVTACLAAARGSLAAESDRFFLWMPVCFGTGIGIYFCLSDEPSAGLVLAALLAGIGVCFLWRHSPLGLALAGAVVLAAGGFAHAKLRTLLVAQPSLARATGVVSVEGWVERLEPRLPRGHRVTIRVRAIAGLTPRRTPYRVRLIAPKAESMTATGSAVRVRAVLRPVPEPVRPGGFDFAKKAWFAGLGAVGFTVGGLESMEGAPSPPIGLRLWARIDNLRAAVARRIRQALPGETGALAVALITGERGSIPGSRLQSMRHSGLAHVLAISGLHMALFAGSLFWLMRAVLAAVPALALRYPIKKWSAAVAIVGGAFYLMLSGAGIATQRAFLMITILFLAVLLDRPALTLRNVAIAACVLLLVFPESLLDVSFQMSFAAVTALVAVYEELSRRAPAPYPRSILGQFCHGAARYLGGIAVTTLVASLAVAPFAAFHFHKLAQYSLLANLAAMPLVGFVVMPMALAAVLAMPLGLERLPLQIMSKGLERLAGVAEAVSSWDGAVVHVAAMPTASLVLLAFGGLWLMLWRGRWRSVGLVIAALGLATAATQPRPDVLIDRDGKLFAVRDDRGSLQIPALTGARYSAEQWRLADGTTAAAATKRPEARVSRCDALACLARVGGKTIAFVRHPAALHEECRRADIVVSHGPVRDRCPKARVVVDRFDLWRNGAHALYFDGQSIRTETVASQRGNRPWVRMRPKAGPGRSTGRALARERR